MKILIIDDEAPIRDVLSASLMDEGYEVQAAEDGEKGLLALRQFQPDIVFLDIRMPGNFDGIQVLQKAREMFPATEFIMISGHGTIETAVKATKLGAWDFVEKPLSMDKISIIIQNVSQYRQEKEEKSALLNKLRRSIALIGEAPSVVQIKQVISRVAPTPSWILLTGEPGTGKELVAQNIHYMSPRASRPFVDLNCASIPEDLLEGEIFGIEKGALPGLEKTKRGKLDLAQGGTLYLEDISEMNQMAQAKLLRYLQEKKYQRVGGMAFIENDVRVIASSSKDLQKEVAEQRFRQDLYDRLNVIPFQIPTLRERPEDIAVLVSYFSDQFSRESGMPKKVFSEKALETMHGYAWPGNVRELKNFVERVYILTPGEYVDVHDLYFAGLVGGEEPSLSEDLGTFREARSKFEREYLVKKIQEHNGNISKTAEAIGLERSYLHRKIKAYGIEGIERSELK
ncbi:MAG TPA: sigma-54 dependent transcriptional regulator [Pseudobdellovibrionaceae bacterium]|nr:sigma-54 dependent transcriptional regulator [Pseudobdellovibrionaceae bacterium]